MASRKEVLAEKFKDVISDSRNDGYLAFPLTDFSQIIKAGDHIVDVGCYDFTLLRNFYEYVDGACSISGYSDEIERVVKARNYFKNFKNVLFFHNSILSNSLKNSSVDILIGHNILGASKKNNRIFKEINRVLKPGGTFLFKELISSQKPHPGFSSYFKKKGDSIFNSVIFNIKKKMNYLKDCRFEMRIIGDGNYYFKKADVSSLQEFCDYIGYRNTDRDFILSHIFAVIIQGTK